MQPSAQGLNAFAIETQAPESLHITGHYCLEFRTEYMYDAVADPGFSMGGRGPRRGGGVDSWGGSVSKILYVKMKESGPLGGVRRACPSLDPPM